MKEIHPDYEVSEDGKQRKAIPSIKVDEDTKYMLVYKQKINADFFDIVKESLGEKIYSVENIKITGCDIESFDFIERLSALKRISFLADNSNQWQNLSNVDKIVSLSLHNLKQGKRYLDNTDFLERFTSLQYLYVNMLGVNSFPQLPKLKKLLMVCGTFRNENNIHEVFDFSSFRDTPSLKIFSGCFAVDRHKIPAEAFVPILENKSIESFEYCQMYVREEKKLDLLVESINPKLKKTSLNFDEILKIRREQIL